MSRTVQRLSISIIIALFVFSLNAEVFSKGGRRLRQIVRQKLQQPQC